MICCTCKLRPATLGATCRQCDEGRAAHPYKVVVAYDDVELVRAADIETAAAVAAEAQRDRETFDGWARGSVVVFNDNLVDYDTDGLTDDEREIVNAAEAA